MNAERVYFDIIMTVNRLVHEKYSKVSFAYNFPKFFYNEDEEELSYEFCILTALQRSTRFVGINFEIEEIHGDNVYDEMPHAAIITARISFYKKEFFMYVIDNKQSVMNAFLYTTFSVQDGIINKRKFSVTNFTYSEVHDDT